LHFAYIARHDTINDLSHFHAILAVATRQKDDGQLGRHL
jgi:hypothetical protein